MRVESELCAYSVEAVRRARLYGLTRVELCAHPELEGTTPSEDVLREAIAVGGVDVWVMIRSRGGDFAYSNAEFDRMKREIFRARELGANGVVFGLLTADGEVDLERTRELVEAAAPLKCTFHRAFDVARDWRRALEDVVASGCIRILTSGQAPSAIEGVSVLRKIVSAARGRVEIMAGAGVNPDNARALLATGVDALHFSARKEGHFADEGFIKKMMELV